MPTDLPPPPAIDPRAPMISHIERMAFDLAPAELDARLSALPLEATLRAAGRLPGVVGVTQLTPGPWRVKGARRLIHLSDGASAIEEVLEAAPGEGFRYEVWGYTTPAARPIAYAIGEFRYLPRDGGGSQLVWTYSFHLRRDRFPGVLGPVGRWLLKTAFVDRAYADLMRGTLAAMKQALE